MTDDLLIAVEAFAETLERLHLSHSPQLTESGLSVIPRLRKLKHLGVRDLPLTDELIAPWGALLDFVGLEFNGSRVTDQGLSAFAGCVQLQSLQIGGTSVGAPTMKWARSLKSLRDLWVRHTRVDDEGVAALAGHPNLRQLFLAGNEFTDAGLKPVASFPRLVWLDVADTRITDSGLKSLVACPALRALDLAGTKLTDACVPTLLQMPSLCYLNIERTKITKEGQRQLAAGLPFIEDMDARRELHQILRAD